MQPDSKSVRPGAASIDAVAAAIATVRTGDPLAAVTVLVPSNYAGLSLRRALGRRGGLANVGFMVPARAAELLATSSLAAGSRPLTFAMRREAIRAVMATAPAPFAIVASHQSTVTALDAAFHDLRQLDAASIASLQARSPRSGALVALFQSFRKSVQDYHDEVDRFQVAAEAVRTASASPLGQVVAYLFRGLNPESEPLYEALDERGWLTRIDPLAADDPALVGRAIVHVVADEDEELRATLRSIAAELDEGRPLHRIAVLFPSSGYAARCFELFTAAGIPCNGSTGGTVGGSVAGRALLALMRLGDGTATRDDVLGALALPLPGIDHYTDRWNALARDARITRGLDQWRDRLEVHAARLRTDADAQPDEYEYLRDRLQRDAQVCDELIAAVARLESLIDADAFGSWSGFASWAESILDGVASRLGSDDQRDHLDSVREIVAELGGLDAFGAPTSRVAAFEALSAALDMKRVTRGKFEQGVFAGSLDEAYGMTFDLVFVLGCTEGVLPASPPEDPLLPPEDRATVPGLEHGRHRHRLRQQQAFDWALGCADQLVLSFPKSSLAAQRANVPSPWLLRVAKALHGSAVYGSNLATLLDAAERPAWLSVTPSFAAAVARRGARASESEWTLAALAAYRGSTGSHPLVTGLPELRRAIEALARHAGPSFSEFDGFVGPEPGLAITSGAPVSPTRLEWWSQCGYRYFLASALRVTENEIPADPDAIDARDRGSLVHAILDAFFASRALGRDPSEPWSDADFGELERITDSHIAIASQSGQLGRYVPWRVEEARLRSALHRTLEVDSAWRRNNRLTFVASEFGFGRLEHRGRPGDAAPEPVRIDTPAGTVAFRGEIDRVDRAADGSVIVYDYKTGKPPGARRFGTTPFDDGARLQLPVYALAASRLHGAASVRAAYWHLMHDKGPGDFLISVDDARAAEFQSLLGHIAGGIARGVFPARRLRPGNGDLCKYCPFDLICPADRARAHQRKQHDPAMAPYFLSAQIDGDDSDAAEDDDA